MRFIRLIPLTASLNTTHRFTTGTRNTADPKQTDWYINCFTTALMDRFHRIHHIGNRFAVLNWAASRVSADHRTTDLPIGSNSNPSPTRKQTNDEHLRECYRDTEHGRSPSLPHNHLEHVPAWRCTLQAPDGLFLEEHVPGDGGEHQSNNQEQQDIRRMYVTVQVLRHILSMVPIWRRSLQMLDDVRVGGSHTCSSTGYAETSGSRREAAARFGRVHGGHHGPLQSPQDRGRLGRNPAHILPTRAPPDRPKGPRRLPRLQLRNPSPLHPPLTHVRDRHLHSSTGTRLQRQCLRRPSEHTALITGGHQPGRRPPPTPGGMSLLDVSRGHAAWRRHYGHPAGVHPYRTTLRAEFTPI